MVRVALIVLHLVLGIAAVGAGQALAREPSGEALSFKTEWLEGSPFPDYRIPGLFLAVVISVTNFVSAVGLWKRASWGPPASMGTGLLLLVWIGIQWLILGYRHWTQLLWTVIFALVAALALVQMRHPRGEKRIAPG